MKVSELSVFIQDLECLESFTVSSARVIELFWQLRLKTRNSNLDYPIKN